MQASDGSTQILGRRKENTSLGVVCLGLQLERPWPWPHVQILAELSEEPGSVESDIVHEVAVAKRSDQFPCAGQWD